MVQKSHLILERSVQDLSRPAVFVNKSQKKNKLEKQTAVKEQVPHKYVSLQSWD